MALSATALASLVFTDHLAAFPSALTATRANAATGVPAHNVPEAFIGALCTAFVNAVLADNVVLLAAVAGTADVVPATPVMPTSVSFPGIAAAVVGFLAEMQWTGVSGAAFAYVVIGSVLAHTAELALLQMNPGLVVGTGTGTVSPATNPGLASLVEANLLTSLPAAFTATTCFGEGDVPGAPVNAVLAAQLPVYASWLAQGFATLVASPSYIGNASITAVAAEVGTGRLT